VLRNSIGSENGQKELPSLGKMAENGKRKADTKESNAKRLKYSKFKATNRGNDDTLSSLKTIEAGWSGIWATCVRGLEAKATAQLREVLDEVWFGPSSGASKLCFVSWTLPLIIRCA